MRSFPSFVKLTGVAVLIAVVALGLFSHPTSIHAGVPVQATDEATATEASTDTTAATTAATEATAAPTEASAEATTAAEVTQYPPCPGPEVAATETAAATEAASAAATEAGTLEATAAATANPNPGYLGVRAEQVQECGVRIVGVVDNSPAAAANLQVEDVIVALNAQAVSGHEVAPIRWLRNEIETRSPGDKITLTVQRKGQQLDIEVTLGSKPEAIPATEAATEVATEAATEVATSAASEAPTEAATEATAAATP